jgi:hypothetical protein
VARTRGAASGVFLLVLGAWAALVPFIGPYLNVAYTPDPDTAWHWTAARGWLEVVPGCVALAAGLLLIMSASRVVTTLTAWFAAAAGAWLVVGPALSAPLEINLGTPDPTSRRSVQALAQVIFFYGIGAAIVFVAGIALGRLTVNTLRDQRAAERRLAAEREAAAAAAAAQRTSAPAGSPAGEREMPRAPEYAGGQRTGAGRHGQPDAQQPTTRQPTADQATTEQATTEQATTERATTEQPAGQPPTQQPPNQQPPNQQPPNQQPPSQQPPNPEQPTTQRPTYASSAPPPRRTD